MICTKCRRPIHPTPQPDTGPQRVWADTKDGPAHTPGCPEPEPMHPNEMTPDGS